MALFRKSEVIDRAERAISFQQNASVLLNEHLEAQAIATQHDVFLSHSYDDRKLILGTAKLIEDLGYTVYIDWRDDPRLDRKRVTRATAKKLRDRMKQCNCLFYSTTKQASESKWMPWELGFKDGDNNRCAILPITNKTTNSYEGQEYLGVYPYVAQANNRKQKKCLWIHRSHNCYINFDAWLEGKEPIQQ